VVREVVEVPVICERERLVPVTQICEVPVEVERIVERVVTVPDRPTACGARARNTAVLFFFLAKTVTFQFLSTNAMN